MTATVTPLFGPVPASDATIKDLGLHVRRVDACRRLLSRRGRRLEITFCDADGNELTCAPSESTTNAVTACAAAWPTDGVGDVIVGVTDPIPRTAFDHPGQTLAAINSAIGDLAGQFLIHPAERTPT